MALVDPLGPRHRPGMRGPCRRLAHRAVDPASRTYRRFTGSGPGLPSVSPPSYRTVRSLWMSLLGLGANGTAFKDPAVGHQVSQTLAGLRPDVDEERSLRDQERD